METLHLLLLSFLASVLLLGVYYVTTAPSGFESPFSSSQAKRKSKKGTHTVLLVGPSGSGKTALFSLLRFGHEIASHTSLKENEAVLRSLDAPEEAEEGALAQQLTPPIQLVDVPGHALLRTRLMVPFLPTTRAVAFLLNTKTGLSGNVLRGATEHLHLLFSYMTLLPNPPSILILLTASTPSHTPAASASLITRAKTSLSRDLTRRLASPSESTTAAALESLASLDGDKGEARLPIEEDEIWKRTAGVFGETWDWEAVQRDLGLDVQWGVLNLGGKGDKSGLLSEKAGGEQGGLDQVKDWLKTL